MLILRFCHLAIMLYGSIYICWYMLCFYHCWPRCWVVVQRLWPCPWGIPSDRWSGIWLQTASAQWLPIRSTRTLIYSSMCTLSGLRSTSCSDTLALYQPAECPSNATVASMTCLVQWRRWLCTGLSPLWVRLWHANSACTIGRASNSAACITTPWMSQQLCRHRHRHPQDLGLYVQLLL